MNEKQRKYIHNQYRQKSVRQLADHLGLSKKEVSVEVRRLISGHQRSPILKLVIIIFMPVLFLILLEGIFRITGMYESADLLIEKQIDGRSWYQLNKDVAKRWFISGRSTVPELNNTLLFEVDKADTVKRVLCLGGSTTAGFPYDNLPNFPTLVRLKLQRYFPRYKIETVNLGISAINSFSVEDMLSGTLPLKPDLVLIYMGHNEFYGAFGGASSQSFGARNMVKTLLWLDRFAIIQNLRKLIMLTGEKTNISRQNKTLMAQMIKDKFIGRNSELFKMTRNNFAKNYHEIVSFYQKKNIPLIISTLSSNLKDQVPFESRWQEENPSNIEKMWVRAKSALKLGNRKESFQLMQHIVQIDTTHAELNYHLGRYYYSLGDTIKAKKYFIRAREYDGMRFRAPLDWNHIIKNIAQKQHIPIVRMDSLFSTRCRGRITGHELFLEHLHPNWRGYNLMADGFVEQILKTKYIPGKHPPFQWSILEKYPWYNVTDVEIGHLVHSILTKGWPFNQDVFRYDQYQPVAPGPIAEKVRDYVNKHGYWNKLHYKSAAYFVEKKDYHNAIREYAGVAAYLPTAKFPREKMGFLYLHLQDFRNAYGVYKQLLKLEPENSEYRCRVGQALAMGYQFKEAIPFLEQGIARDVKDGRKIKEQEFYGFKFWLGFCYANSGQLLFAKRQLEQVLEKMPQHGEARKLLNQVIAYYRKNQLKK